MRDHYPLSQNREPEAPAQSPKRAKMDLNKTCIVHDLSQIPLKQYIRFLDPQEKQTSPGLPGSRESPPDAAP